MRSVLLVTPSLFFVVVACSSGGTDGSSIAGTSPDGGASTGSGQQQQGASSPECAAKAPTVDAGSRQPYFHCCVTVNNQSATYACPDKDTMLKCAPQGMPSPGAPPQMPDPSGCTKVQADPDVWCTVPETKTGDCTIAMSCKDNTDCKDENGRPLLGYWCNTALHRCFDMRAHCVGTKCNDFGDCSYGETCDTCTHKCVMEEGGRDWGN